MRSAIKMTSVAAALGAGALGLSLVGVGSGVGAQFTDSGTARASIDVGTFSCALTTDDDNVTISADGHTATVDLGTITSSAAGDESASVTVTNTGTIPLSVHWTEATTGNIDNTGHIHPLAAADDAALVPGASQDATIGFAWDELDNHDLGRSGTAVYTASCDEVAAMPAGISLFSQDGGTAYWDGQQAVLHLPGGAAGSAGAGVNILNVGSNLPSAPPVFTTTAYNAGSPRLAIGFDDGTHVFGYPSQYGNTWEVPGSTSPATWSDVQAYANTRTVTEAFVVLDTSGGTPVTADIACLNYSGTALIGSCSVTP